MAKNANPRSIKKPSFGFAGYLLLSYWAFFFIIHLITDVFIDLYTDKDYSTAFGLALAIALPLAAYTTYLGKDSIFSSWYSYMVFPLVISGLYLASAYFTLLKLDLLISAAVKNETEQVVPVKAIKRVFARKAGFIYTNVSVIYNNQLVTLEGTRTSYFLLSHYQTLRFKMGRSFLGSDYITYIEAPEKARWDARWAYVKDWFKRSYWVAIIMAILFLFGLFKDKFFTSLLPAARTNPGPIRKLLKGLFVITLALLVISMLVLLILSLVI
jgi:hypothetical protein